MYAIVDPTVSDVCSVDEYVCGPAELTTCINVPGGYNCSCNPEYGYFYVGENLPCTTG